MAEFDDELKRLEDIRKNNQPMRKCRYEQWELAYIKANYLRLTDKELAEGLHRRADSILMKRKELKLTKGNGRPRNAEREAAQGKKSFTSAEYEVVNDEYKKLSKEQKRKLFDNKFRNTKRYEQLRQKFTESEIDAYSERWLDYINTWETLLTTEEDNLGLALTQLILADRVLIRQREALEGEGDNAVPIDLYDRQYRDHIELYNKLMSSLAGTRAQRLNLNKEERVTLTSVVQALQDQETRKRAGREAAIIDLAKQVQINGMRAKHFLRD